MSSHRSTTTAVVRDVPLTRGDLARALAGYYESAGYVTTSLADVADEVHDLLVLGSRWAVGNAINGAR